MRSLHVLMVAPGDDIHALRPLDWLLNAGCQVSFADHTNPFPEGRNGYSFHRFPYPRGERLFSRFFGPKAAAALSLATSTPRLRALFRRTNAALTHVHWVDARAYCCAQAGLRPLVLTVWGSDINDLVMPRADRSYRNRIGSALAAADRVLMDSSDMQTKCETLAGKALSSELLTLGVNTQRFCPGYAQEAAEWRRELGVPLGTTVFLSIRGWSPLYRHEAILEAFAAALPRFISPAVLVFKVLRRGSTDPVVYETRIRALARRLGVTNQVRWMGEVPLTRLPEIYAMADAVVNYPSMDAFPVTFLEAAASQCFVVSGKLPAYENTFAERYFRMVSSEDLESLSAALVTFVAYQDRPTPEKLAELRRWVCDHHDERIIGEQLLGVYQKLAKPVIGFRA